MNIKDLIEKLKNLPANTQVLVQGYEGGFDAVKTVRQINVVKNQDAEDWDGEYEEAEKDNKGGVLAVVMMGNRR